MALPDHLLPLLDAACYPHPCGEIELIETHISWVILTGDYAYKLKKPVRFNFVDFSTLALRAHFCAEEVRCNRAFAPDIYLGVAAIVGTGGGLAVLPQAQPESDGDDQEVQEWAVQMRQFDPAQGLDRLLERDALEDSALDAFGRDLARCHEALPRLPGVVTDVPLRIFGPVEDNFAEIGETPLADQHAQLVASAMGSARRVGEALRPLFDARMTGGFVRECHGDLHLANLALIDGTVTAFDCLEFNENLRWIDTMSDVAFLFMDCHIRAEVALAYRFLDSYLDQSGDYEGARLLHYFAAYRAVVRAKVAALRWVQSPDREGARRFAEHIDWADRWLARPPGKLVLTCGLSGSGKSYLAARLLGKLPAVRLRSDVARKRLAGLGVLEASDSGIDSGLYAPARSDETFAYLAEMTGALLRSGEHVIVDATFIERGRRESFAGLSASLGTSCTIIHCDAPTATLRARLAQRAAQGGDPSEADAQVLEWQQARFEPFAAHETVLRVDTGVELDESVLTRLTAAID